MKTKFSRLTALLSLTLFTLVACKEEVNNDTAMADEKIPGIVLENMDLEVSPKDDFYNYVNGNWMKTAQIPKEEASWGGIWCIEKIDTKRRLRYRKNLQRIWSLQRRNRPKESTFIF